MPARPGQPIYALLTRLLWAGLFSTGLLLGANAGYSQPVPVQRNSGALVVQLGDGSILTDCVRLRDRGWSTAEELLTDSAFDSDITTDPIIGLGICQIEQQGCNTDPDEGETTSCFCECETSTPCNHWLYFILDGQEWQQELPGKSLVEEGDVVGWAWGDDTTQIDEVVSFSEVCMAATPTPTGTSTATATGTPTDMPTETTRPTDEPAATDEPTSEPSADEPVPDLQQEAPAPRQASSSASSTASPTRAPTRTPRPTRPRARRSTSTPAATHTAVRAAAASTGTPAPTLPPPPTDTPAPTLPPPPTNTLVPTRTPAPTIPPAPTLEPLPTATATELPTPTIDQTATMAAMLQTEIAFVPTDAPLPTSDPVFVTPSPNQTARAVLEQAEAAAQARRPVSEGEENTTTDAARIQNAASPYAAPASIRMDAPSAADQETSTTRNGMGNLVFWGLGVTAFMVVLLALQAAQQRSDEAQQEE